MEFKLELTEEDVYTLFSWAFSANYDSGLREDDLKLIKLIEKASGIKFEL